MPLEDMRVPDPIPIRTPRKVMTPAPQPAAREAANAGSGAVTEAPDSTYYGARQLDVYPSLLTALDVRDAQSAPVTGRVLVLLLIDDGGIVNEVSVVEAEPAGYFDENAKRALKTARFAPAMKNGRAVKSRLLVQINYGGDAAVQ